jgi:hypothetical protein
MKAIIQVEIMPVIVPYGHFYSGGRMKRNQKDGKIQFER